MISPAFPKLHFREPFEDLVAFEVPCKGWYDGVTVELEDGRKYPVFFYDPTRLAQDLEAGVAQGLPFVAEPLMIVVPEINEVAMRTAISLLHRRGWFNEHNPI